MRLRADAPDRGVEELAQLPSLVGQYAGHARRLKRRLRLRYPRRYTGWIHAVGEPNGKYVFRYTVHGTLNGTPVDLTASSPPIVMTD